MKVCTVRTGLCGKTGVRESADELNLKHNHCHRSGLQELVVHVHRDVVNLAQYFCTALGWWCLPTQCRAFAR